MRWGTSGLVGVLVALTVGVSGGAGHATGVTIASATVEPPVQVTTVPNGYIASTELLGSDVDGSYAVFQALRDGNDPYSAYVVRADGTVALQVGLSAQPVTAVGDSYGDGVFDYLSRTSGGAVVHAYPVSGSPWTVTVVGTVLGVVGPAGVVVQASDLSLDLVAPDGTDTVLGNPGEKIANLSGDHSGALACAASGQAYLVDLDTPAVTPVSGLTDCTSGYERGGVRAVLTTDASVVRLDADGRPGAAVPVPYDAARGNPYPDSPSEASDPLQLVATPNATFVSDIAHDFAGPAAGPLTTLGQQFIDGVAGGAGDDGYVDAGGAIYRIDATTSPAATVTLGDAAGQVGRIPALPTDQPGATAQVVDDGQTDDGQPLDVDDAQLTAGPHTLTATAYGPTGYGSPVTRTVDVVAHPVAAFVGAGRAVQELTDGRTVDLGGAAASPPSVTSIGSTVYIAVEGTNHLVYLRTEQLGWTRVTTGTTCQDPTIDGYDDPLGVQSLQLACVGEQKVLISAHLAVQPGRIGAAAGTGGVASGSAFYNESGQISGEPIAFTSGPDYVLGTNGQVYSTYGNEFARVGLRCAGPLGGGLALRGFNLPTTLLACEQPGGALAVLTDTGNVVSLGGVITGEPAVAVQSDGSAVITVLGTGGRLYQQTFTGTAGTGWHALGGVGSGGLSGTWRDFG